MWILLCTLAFGAKVDVAPSGAVVTVRPADNERVAVLFKGQACVEISIAELPENTPMWLVNPDSWRQAVALAAKYDAQMALPTELQALNRQLELDLTNETALRSSLRLDLEHSEATRIAETKALRRSRTHWTVASGVVGLIAGSATVAVVVL